MATSRNLLITREKNLKCLRGSRFFGQLLTDGTASAASFVALQNGAKKYAPPGYIIHAAVLEKTSIFSGNEGLADVGGEGVWLVFGAVLFEITAQQNAVGGVNVCEAT